MGLIESEIESNRRRYQHKTAAVSAFKGDFGDESEESEEKNIMTKKPRTSMMGRMSPKIRECQWEYELSHHFEI